MTMEVKRIRDVIGRPFTVRDLTDGYLANMDDGSTTDSIFGYGGRLNIRPSFQRNSVYNDQKRDAVIQTILNKCPLNTMYWVDKEDGTYECLDGQQRTLAICKYIAGEFSVFSPRFPGDLPQDFNNLSQNLQNIAEQILDYELDIYVCRGTPEEKMLWFHTINTAGEPLNEQELRNSSYTGPWLTDAKSRFSVATGRGVKLADTNPDNDRDEPLLNGSWNRQEYLETALRWAGNAFCKDAKDGKYIEKYMLDHQNNADASELWQYFSTVLEWVRSKFTAYNAALKGMDWGAIYEAYKNGDLDNNIISKSAIEINEAIAELVADDEVTAKMKGIYQYVIFGKPKYLSLRQFEEKTARKIYEKQHHQCPYCLQEGNRKEYAFKEMHADHIMPWSKGGKTVEENCQMLCSVHNESKGSKW